MEQRRETAIAAGANLFQTTKVANNQKNDGISEPIPLASIKDEVMLKFMHTSEEDKDILTCDDIFALYLRDVSKRVNEGYYKVCLRFVLLFRDCLNEFGWFKRRDHFVKAEMLEEDEVLQKLKKEEEANED